LERNLREEVKKHRTYYKTFHRGFGKGITEGDIRERLGSIKVQIQKWPDDIPITVRDLKEMLGRCRYYLSESQIRKLTNEGFLHGIKVYNLFWIYPKPNLYDWVVYLQEVGLRFLIDKGIIKKEKKDEVLIINKRKRT